MSPVKLGFAVFWPAFWTGLPIKLGLGLVLLAMGAMQLEALAGLALLLLLASPVTALGLPIVTNGFDLHLAEGAGLAFLFLLAIPIDIWALGLVGRTVFLERLRVEPPEGLGLTLWWQAALISAIYFPLFYFVESSVAGVAKSVAHSIMELELLKAVPVAERISIELTLWGIPAIITLIALTLGWLWLIGRIVQRQAKTARPASDSYQTIIRRWDLMRVPADQTLMLVAFTGAGVLLVLMFWAFIPVSTPHPHPDYKLPVVKVVPLFKPAEVLNKSEKVLAKAEEKMNSLEAKAEEEKAKPKPKGKAGGKEKAAGKEASAIKPQGAPAAGKAAGSGSESVKR